MAQTVQSRKALPRPDFGDVPGVRRRNMAAVRNKDTKPEMLVRQGLHRMGYRYRLHDRRLPGRPDLVFPSRRAVVFVHGCFFHRHDDPGCKNSVLPRTRRAWWAAKFAANRQRDAEAKNALEDEGWRCEIVWECEIRRDLPLVLERLRRFLGFSQHRS
jgi:DNA mismatch endonuclease Vsr